MLLEPGKFWRSDRKKKDIFWTLLKVVLTGFKENSKFVGLSSWKDGVIYCVGKVCERMSGT